MAAIVRLVQHVTVEPGATDAAIVRLAQHVTVEPGATDAVIVRLAKHELWSHELLMLLL